MILWLIDPLTLQPYTFDKVDRTGLGGTERMAGYVGQHLARQHQLHVFQHSRNMQQQVDGVSYYPLRELLNRLSPVKSVQQQSDQAAQPDCIVVINAWKLAVKIRKSQPRTRILLWLHVFPGKHNRQMGAALTKAGISVLCVSHAHRKTFMQWCQRYGSVPHTGVMYNIVAAEFSKQAVKPDKNQLFFASSPHKGLNETLMLFEQISAQLPELYLTVCSPGYLQWGLEHIPQRVHFIDTLQRHELSQQMAGALCLFYPQTEFAETFGMVIAEANASGLPVLVHRGLGANDEVVSSAEQLIDGHNPAMLITRIMQWQQQRPVVNARPQFQPDSVLQAWDELLISPEQETA